MQKQTACVDISSPAQPLLYKGTQVFMWRIMEIMNRLTGRQAEGYGDGGEASCVSFDTPSVSDVCVPSLSAYHSVFLMQFLLLLSFLPSNSGFMDHGSRARDTCACQQRLSDAFLIIASYVFPAPSLRIGREEKKRRKSKNPFE